MPGHVTPAVLRLSPRSGCGGGPRKVLPTRLIQLSKIPRIEARTLPRAWPTAAAKWSRLPEQAIIVANAVFVFITAEQSKEGPHASNV
jgi:hypothetical protein